MPKVLTVEGYRLFFFSNEPPHEPPHVHVEKGDGYAKLFLGPVRLVYSEGLTRPELRRLIELANEHEALCLERWHEYFDR